MSTEAPRPPLHLTHLEAAHQREAALRAEVAEVRQMGWRVVLAWERLGKCEDEFGPGDGPCNEYADALDTAIDKLRLALAPEEACP